MLDRHDLTDGEWARREPLLPDRAPRRGGRWADHRQVINGVFFQTRTGTPWRDLPACYGNWKTVYNRHRRWSTDGTWVEVLAELRRGSDGGDGPEWTLSVDSSAARAHRLQEAEEHGWLGEVAAIETTMAAAQQKLEAMRELAARRTVSHLGMPDARRSTGRTSLDT